MKLLGIFYFSGTGNTEIVANMINEEFLNHEYNVDIIRIEDVLKNDLKIDIKRYDLIGVGCQVIGFGVPRLMSNFVRHLPKGNGKRVFIFRTAGGVVPQNYNASKPIIRKLNRKGYKVFHERLFSIGSNWAVRFDDEITRQLYSATKKKTGLMCNDIINGQKRFLKTGIALKIIMEVTMFLSQRSLRLVGKDMIIDKNCTNCGLCIKNCPARNIYETNGKIKHKLSCNSCMRCVYACPQKAIKFRLLSFFSVPGGYNIKRILEKSGEIYKNEKVPLFLNEYLKNDGL